MWSVAVTAPNCEHKAVLNLERQGFTTYLPRMRERHKIAPLFPRYLFVDIIDRWHNILGTIGINGLLMNGEKPANLKNQVIDHIRAQENSDGVIDLRREHFKKGQKLRVLKGWARDQIVIYAGMDAHYREVVLMHILGGEVKLQFSREDLIAV